MLVWDTGAFSGLTPFWCDFIDYIPLERTTVKDISKANKVLGIETVVWKFKSRQGDIVFIPAVVYHMPECNINLLNPQAYFQLHGGNADVTDDGVAMNYLVLKNTPSIFLLTRRQTYQWFYRLKLLWMNNSSLDHVSFCWSFQPLSNLMKLVLLHHFAARLLQTTPTVTSPVFRRRCYNGIGNCVQAPTMFKT